MSDEEYVGAIEGDFALVERLRAELAAERERVRDFAAALAVARDVANEAYEARDAAYAALREARAAYLSFRNQSGNIMLDREQYNAIKRMDDALAAIDKVLGEKDV